jgi:glycosyltransferase involved in cell wall biosynthesis
MRFRAAMTDRRSHQPAEILGIGPATGGVAEIFRHSMRLHESRGHRVRVIGLSRDRAPGWAGLRAAVRARRLVASARTVHLEFGSNDTEAFWFAVVATRLRPDCVCVIHDYPKLVNAPGAALIPVGSRVMNALAYRLLSPSLDGRVTAGVVRRAGIVVTFGEQAKAGTAAQGAKLTLRAWLPAYEPTPHVIPPSEGRHLLFAGFIGESKGVDVLFRAWAEVSAACDLPLLVAGAALPPADEWIDQLVREFASTSNPPRILGKIELESDLQRLIDESAAVILPYRRSSPASGILVRAMRAGRPLVMTPVQATAGILDSGGNSILVPIDDHRALAEAITLLVRSPSMRDRLGAAAAATADRLFDWTRFLDDLETAYRLSRPGASG